MNDRHPSSSRMHLPTTRPRHRRVVAVLNPLAVAAMVAVGAVHPQALGQTIIVPLTGAASTQTTVTRAGTVFDIHAGTLRAGNAFNTFSQFQVAAGDTARLRVPANAAWLVNIVKDSRVRIDGVLQGLVDEGRVGGNVLFIDSHGFAVGPTGQVNVGRLAVAAPSAGFVDGLLANGPGMDGAAVDGVLAGRFERSATGQVSLHGLIEARDGVQVMAGHGGDGPAVDIGGRIVVQGRRTGTAVNLGDVRSITPVVDRDGVIDITTPGDLRLDGVLISDGSHWSQAGAVRVTAGGDIAVGAATRISTSGADGSGQAGGTVVLLAQRDIANQAGSQISARGDAAGAGGFIEYSGLRQLKLDGMRFDAGSDTGVAGRVWIDPTGATISGDNTTHGGDFELGDHAAVTMLASARISTRKVAESADPFDGTVVSTGNSGHVRISAPSITIESGALIDASVVNAEGSAHSAGDIVLKAHSTSTGTTMVTLAHADSTIEVAGTLRGRHIALDAQAKSQAEFGGVSGTIQQDTFNFVLDQLDLPLKLALSYVQATGNARVTLKPTAVVRATGKVEIMAKAERAASAETLAEGADKVNLSAGVVRLAGSTAVELQGGASIRADGDVAVVAASKSTATMQASAEGKAASDTEANMASVVFAGALSEVDTSVTMDAASRIEAGGGLTIQAFTSNGFETAATVTAGGEAVVGAVGALALHRSSTIVDLSGRVDAVGSLQVSALTSNHRNKISATAETSTEAGGGLSMPGSLEWSNAEAQAAAEAQLLSGVKSLVTQAGKEAEAASGGGGDEAAPDPTFRLGSAVAWSASRHTTRARFLAGAVATAGNHLALDAQAINGTVQSAARAEAASQSKDGQGGDITVAAAFAMSDHALDTQAVVGAGAQVAARRVAVHAANDMPMMVTWGQWDDVFAVYGSLLDTANLEMMNTRVGARGDAAQLAVAGAVNLGYFRHTARAWVDQDATVRATATDAQPWSYTIREVPFASDVEPVLIGSSPYRLTTGVDAYGADLTSTSRAPLDADGDPVSGTRLNQVQIDRAPLGDLSVTAATDVTSMHFAGGLAGSAEGDGGSVGGTFSLTRHDNTTLAGIADRATLEAGRLDVAAQTRDWVLSIAPTAGAGAGIAANGIASSTQLNNVTRASISREADVTAGTVDVRARLGLWSWSIIGAVTASDSSGVGIGLAVNTFTGDTRAGIGDNDADGPGGNDTDEGAVGAVRTSRLTVGATTDGRVGAVAVSGAAAGASEPQGKGMGQSLGKSMDGQLGAFQTQLGDRLSAMGPLAEVGAALQKQGLKNTESAEAPDTSKAPSFSVAGVGAAAVNLSDRDTRAIVDRAHVTGLTAADRVTVRVRALSDVSQIAVAGGGALALSKNSSSNFNAGIAGAVAVQKSGDDTEARVSGSQLTQLGEVDGRALEVQAFQGGERTSAGVGLAVNASTSGTVNAAVAGSGSATLTHDNVDATVEDSVVSGHETGVLAGDAAVQAYNRSRVGAGAGALTVGLSGKGAAGIGAAVTVVDLAGRTSAQWHAGSLSRVDDLFVSALGQQQLVGLGAVAGVQSGQDAKGQFVGSFVFQEIGHTLSAKVTGGAEIDIAGNLLVIGGGAPSDGTLDAAIGTARASALVDYELSESDNAYSDEMKAAVGGGARIVGVAGVLGASLGGSTSKSLGLSYVQNSIQSSQVAELNADVTAGGSVSVLARSDARIVGVSAGASVASGSFSGMGSAAVNLIGQHTQAKVTGGRVSADHLTVATSSESNLFGMAGNLSIAVGNGQGTALGAAIAYANTGSRTFGDGSTTTRAARNEASIGGGAVIDVGDGTGSVIVRARNTSDLKSAAASGAASDGSAAFAGTATWNELGDITSATIDTATVRAGSLSVTSGEAADGRTAQVQSLAGALGVSTGYAAGVALSLNTLQSQRAARIAQAGLTIAGRVDVIARAEGGIGTLAATLAGGQNLAAAGSSAVSLLGSKTEASVSDSSLAGTASALKVEATSSGHIQSLAGAVSASMGQSAIGGALSINALGVGGDEFTVSAGLSQLTLDAPVGVSVSAGLSGDIESIAVSGGASAGMNAINGSATTNFIHARVQATAQGLAQNVLGTSLTLSSENTAHIASLAGAVNGSGGNAVGLAASVNDIAGSVESRLTDSAIQVSGAVGTTARSAATIQSIAASGSAGSSNAVTGSLTTNGITSSVVAQMSGVTQSGTSASVTVQAEDRSWIESLAGSVSGGGTAAVGGAAAVNYLGRSADKSAGDKEVLAEVSDSTLDVSGAVTVQALSRSTIRSLGAAAGAAGNAAVTGSNTTNLLDDDVKAVWSGGSLRGAEGGTLVIRADDEATIESLAGNFAGGGTAAVGAAMAINRIGTRTAAGLSGGTVSTGDVAVQGLSRNRIDTIAVGMSAAATAGVQGSVAVSQTTADTRARIGGGAEVDAVGNVVVSADSHDRILGLAGAIGLAGAGAGVAGGVQTNLIDSSTSAGIEGATTRVDAAGRRAAADVNGPTLEEGPDLMRISALSNAVLDGASFEQQTARGVVVQATSIQQLGALTAVASGAVPTLGASTAVGASVNVDLIGGSTRAFVDAARINTVAGADAAQDARVMAANHAMIASAVAALSASDVGVSGAIGTEVIQRSTTAEVVRGAEVSARGDLAVQALSTQTVAQLAAGLGGGTYAGVAGSGDVVLMKGQTLAQVDASRISADTVSVQADGVQRSNLIAGAVGAGGVAGAGASFTVSVSGADVRALVHDSEVAADGAVSVLADNRTESLAVSAAAGAGGVVGGALGAAVTVLQGQSAAKVTGTSTIQRRTRATGIVGSTDDAPVAISLQSGYDRVDAAAQKAVRFSLNDDSGRVSDPLAEVTVTDGDLSVPAFRQADGTYTADVSTLADGPLQARVVLTEGGVSKTATTVLIKETGINGTDTELPTSTLPRAQTRIATLSPYETLGGSNQRNVRLLLKGAAGPTSLGNEATVVVSDGTREVTATRLADGSYTADVSSLGDGMLTALVRVTGESGTTSSRVTFAKEAGVGSLTIAATEHVDISHNAGQVGAGNVAGVGASANVVIGRSAVDARLSSSRVRVADQLAVTAEREAEVDLVTATGGIGGTAGISGAVGVLIFGAAPDDNARAELGGDAGTLARIDAATQADRAGGTGQALSDQELARLNSGAQYGVSSSFGGASGLHRTSAVVDAVDVTTGSLRVNSLDRTAVSNSAGAVAAGGTAGIGAGVAVTQLGGANEARVQATSLVSGGDIVIDAGERRLTGRTLVLDNLALQGSGGLVGVGAAVSVARNQTASSAALSGSVRAGGAISVRALDEAALSSEAVGFSGGAVAAGAVVATGRQDSSVSASVAGHLVGAGLSVQAVRNGSTRSDVVGSAGGVVAGNAAVATADDRGSVQVGVASGTRLDAGSGRLDLAAKANPKATATALGISVAAGAALGASVATSTVDTDVAVLGGDDVHLAGGELSVAAVLGSGDAAVDARAVAGGGGLLLGLQGAGAVAANEGRSRVELGNTTTLAVAGGAALSSADAVAIRADATGVGAGFVGAGVAVATARGDSTVSTSAGRLAGTVGGSLNVSSRGDESVRASAVAGAGGVVAGAGAEATVDHALDARATVSSAGDGVAVGGEFNLRSDRVVRYDADTSTINASLAGGSGAVTRSTLQGSAVARLDDDSVVDAGRMRVLATNDVARIDASANSADGGGGGVLAGAGADVSTVIDGSARAELGERVDLAIGKDSLLPGLLELRAYNQLRGSSRGRLDLGGAVPIALTETSIRSTATADAAIGRDSRIEVAGEIAAHALSYLDLEANTITKTYGLAAGARGDAAATATVANTVTVGQGSHILGDQAISLLAGQDRDFNRNKHFITARADLFNHAAVPVSVNPDVSASLTLDNQLNVGSGSVVRSGGTIQLGGVEGLLVVEGKGKVSDWTRDLGEVLGISSEYGSTTKTLNAGAVLAGSFEAGYGNKQRLVIGREGQIVESVGNIRYTVTSEDMAATGAAYLQTLQDQLQRYGKVPEVEAFVNAELDFYKNTLVNEGFAERDPATGQIVPREGVQGTFLNLRNVRAGSGNIELFGNNVTGSASLTARADSEIYIENRSPMNLRARDLIIDSSGGFAKYNGAYLKSNGDIAAFNRDIKSGVGLSIDSIDTRGGAAGESLPRLTLINNYLPIAPGAVGGNELRFTAPDGTWSDLRQDQTRAPEIRINGLAYNKLGPISLTNTAGSISVIAEDPAVLPRLDGLSIQINAGKNFALSSPTLSQSVGGSPESLYAVHYDTDQQAKLSAMGIQPCGKATPGVPTVAADFDSGCYRAGSGGIYASGGIFLGARYLNINGTVQSGQPDFNVTLTDASIGKTVDDWKADWRRNRGLYLSQGRSPLVQVSGRRPTDSEDEINKQFANRTLSVEQHKAAIDAIRGRMAEPVIYYDAEADRLKVASTVVKGGLVEVVGTVINTGGGVLRAMDGYARIKIDNQTRYGLDLAGLDTGGEVGIVRITDLAKPVIRDGRTVAYEVTTYARDPATGAFGGVVTAGRGATAEVLRSVQAVALGPQGDAPALRARFTFNPKPDSTYVWSAGYDYATEKRYWYKKSSMLWGAINLGAVSWNDVQTFVKTRNPMPEGIYVGYDRPKVNNSPVDFTISSQTFETVEEKQVYYRSWSKCGFLCFKKTYYIDMRTEAGKKDVFTQKVRADRPINVELVGYGSGSIDVRSQGGLRLEGDIVNQTGSVSLVSTQGAIEQVKAGAVTRGVDLNFVASSGIGTEGAPVNVATGSGSFTARSTRGDVSILGASGALRVNEVSTSGRVWLRGDEGITGNDPAAVHVRGSRILLSSARGGIGEFRADGSVGSTLNIQTEDSPGGGITATAARGIALKQGQGNLWIDQVASNGGDVYIEAAGDLIDNNRNESRDLRTEAELLALWNQAALQGDAAEQSRDRTLLVTRQQYRRYWGLRNAEATLFDSSGKVLEYRSDPFPEDYSFVFSEAERAQLGASGVTPAQIARMEADRTAEVRKLHADYGAAGYQATDAHIVDAINAANRERGIPELGANATWSDKELKAPLPRAIFFKTSTDTQTRIEEPNVVGNRVVLKPGGQIGRDDGSVVIDLRKAGGLTTADQLAIMSAETDDMSLDTATWRLTVVKKDTFDVLSNRLNVVSNGFVYLGSESTDAYPNGGNANLERVAGNGEVRIKVAGSILNASDTTASVIQGTKAILEAGSGSIGSAAKPVTLTLTGGTAGTLTARAQEGIWIQQTGDMRLAEVFSPATVTLTAERGIIDSRGERTHSLQAQEASLVARAGTIGSLLKPLTVKMSSAGGVNAQTSQGYSVYLAGADTGLTVKDIQSGRDLYLEAQSGTLRLNGAARAFERLDLAADGSADIEMAPGASLTSLTAQGTISGDDIGLAKVDVARNLVVTARGSITDTGGDGAVNVAARGVTLLAPAGSIGTALRPLDIQLKQQTTVSTVAAGDTHLSADTGDLRVAQVQAGGTASLASARSIIDVRGTVPQAVSARDIRLAAGLDLGSSGVAFTVRHAAAGAVELARAGGSIYLTAPNAALRVADFNAVAGQAVLNGMAAGLELLGLGETRTGLQLNARGRSLNVAASAALTNATGTVRAEAATLSMADGASWHGGTGTFDLSTTGSMTVTGLSSNGTAATAISLRSGGALIDGGDRLADIRVGSTGGGVSIVATGSVGNLALDAGALNRRLETEAPRLAVTSSTGSIALAQAATAVVAAQLTARASAELSAAPGLAGLTATAGEDIRLASAAGAVRVTSATAGRDLVIDAATTVDLGRSTASRDILADVATPGAHQVLGSVVSAGRHLQVTAQGAAGASTLGTLTARTGSAAVRVGGGLTVGSLTAAGGIDLEAGGNSSLSRITSGTGSIDVVNGAGHLNLSSLVAAQSLTVDAGAGSIQASALNARGGALALHAAGAIATTDLAAGTAVTVASTGGTVTTTTVRAGQDITIDGQGAVRTGALTSTAGAIDVASVAAGVTVASATARTRFEAASSGAMSVASFTVSHGDATLTAHGGTGTMAVTRGTAAGRILADAGAQANLGSLTSTGAGLDLRSRSGPLVLGAATAATDVLAEAEGGSLQTAAITSRNGAIDLGAHTVLRSTGTLTAGTTVTLQSGTATVTTAAVSGRTGVSIHGAGALSTGALSSSAGSIDIESTGAGATVASATAASGLTATVNGPLALASFAVRAGGATLTTTGTQGGMTLNQGSASGPIQVLASGNATLGTLTSTLGLIDARSSGGGLRFTSLTARNAIQLRAFRAWGSGAQAGHALFGTTLSAGAGIDARATQGHLEVGTLTAVSDSTLEATSGQLKVGTIRSLPPAKLSTRASGTRTLPKGY